MKKSILILVLCWMAVFVQPSNVVHPLIQQMMGRVAIENEQQRERQKIQTWYSDVHAEVASRFQEQERLKPLQPSVEDYAVDFDEPTIWHVISEKYRSWKRRNNDAQPVIVPVVQQELIVQPAIVQPEINFAASELIVLKPNNPSFVYTHRYGLGAGVVFAAGLVCWAVYKTNWFKKFRRK